MKKILFSAIIIATVIGCAKTKINTDTASDQIRLSSGIEASKAAYSGDVAVTGLQILRADATTTPASFDDATLLTANRTTDANDITFTAAQYYDGANNAYFLGYFPAATVATNVATWTIDGKTDIMTSQIVDAGTDAAPLVPVMAFKHALAQIEVVCKAELGNIDAVKARWGKIESIKLKAAQPEMTFTYATQVTAGSGTEAALSLVGSDYTADFASIDIPADDNATANAAGMFVPTATQTITLLIKTADQAEREVEIDFLAGNTFEKGKKHTATLTFSTQSIKVKSTIEEWGVGNSGAGIVK